LKKAEKEFAEKGNESQLHLIIFDEIDSICKQRGSTSGGTGVNDSVVNQLLTKMDGVKELNNILVIGMTNRKDLIDEALLRPGRFELKLEIGLPDEDGREQILRIHTKPMKVNNKLEDDVDLRYLAKKTKNFSGAELYNLVSIASTHCARKLIDLNNLSKKVDYDLMKISMNDFEFALTEIKPKFGVSTDEIDLFKGNKIINYSEKFLEFTQGIDTLIDQIKGEHSKKFVVYII